MRRPSTVAVVAYLVALAVNRSLVEVRGPSMEPTLWPGDRLLTLPLWVPGTGAGIRPGRVVVVADPSVPAGQPDHLVVKRIRAVADGRVDVRGDDPWRSTDSRTWGPLPRAAVRRVVLGRWPDLRTSLTRR